MKVIECKSERSLVEQDDWPVNNLLIKGSHNKFRNQLILLHCVTDHEMDGQIEENPLYKNSNGWSIYGQRSSWARRSLSHFTVLSLKSVGFQIHNISLCGSRGPYISLNTTKAMRLGILKAVPSAMTSAHSTVEKCSLLQSWGFSSSHITMRKEKEKALWAIAPPIWMASCHTSADGYGDNSWD